MNIKTKPWMTPNFVIADIPQTHNADAPKWALKDVDEQTLSEMCDEFRAEIFKKACKMDPRLKPVKKC